MNTSTVTPDAEGLPDQDFGGQQVQHAVAVVGKGGNEQEDEDNRTVITTSSSTTVKRSNVSPEGLLKMSQNNNNNNQEGRPYANLGAFIGGGLTPQMWDLIRQNDNLARAQAVAARMFVQGYNDNTPLDQIVRDMRAELPPAQLDHGREDEAGSSLGDGARAPVAAVAAGAGGTGGAPPDGDSIGPAVAGSVPSADAPSGISNVASLVGRDSSKDVQNELVVAPGGNPVRDDDDLAATEDRASKRAKHDDSTEEDAKPAAEDKK